MQVELLTVRPVSRAIAPNLVPLEIFTNLLAILEQCSKGCRYHINDSFVEIQKAGDLLDEQWKVRKNPEH